MSNLFEVNEKKYAGTNARILIQAPTNGALMYYLGGWVEIFRFWGFEAYLCYNDQQQELALKEYSPNVIITTNDSYFFDTFNHSRIADYKKNNDCLVLVIAGTKDFPIQDVIGIKNCVTGDAPLTAFFGFNPFHLKALNCRKPLDWFFVGTNSMLKENRAQSWLYKIIQNKEDRGVLAGVGWELKNIGQISIDVSSYFYNISKVNLNYHLDSQIDSENEINERVHAISACCGFQLCDNPAAIYKFYDESEICICQSPEEYIDKYAYYLTQDAERDKMRIAAYSKAWNNYSLFHTMDEIGKYIYSNIK
jgi:hypothetical protein